MPMAVKWSKLKKNNGRAIKRFKTSELDMTNRKKNKTKGEC